MENNWLRIGTKNSVFMKKCSGSVDGPTRLEIKSPIYHVMSHNAGYHNN